MSCRLAVAVLGLAVVAGGCDSRSESVEGSGSTTNASRGPSPADPSTAPTTTTGPATTQTAEAMMDIDGNMVLFPPARVRLDEADGKLIARLFSDDPKHALDENYDGNSFYLQLDVDPADTPDGRSLGGTVLTYRGSGSERDDSPYGIFLEGRRWILQPADVRIAFEAPGANPSPDLLDVQLSGTFLLFDSANESAKPRRATVAATMPAILQTRK